MAYKKVTKITEHDTNPKSTNTLTDKARDMAHQQFEKIHEKAKEIRPMVERSKERYEDMSPQMKRNIKIGVAGVGSTIVGLMARKHHKKKHPSM